MQEISVLDSGEENICGDPACCSVCVVGIILLLPPDDSLAGLAMWERKGFYYDNAVQREILKSSL